MGITEITETRTYLTFTLDEEDFAVDVSNVREVLDFTDVTRVPRTPDFMKGVINLRGSVVPVVDMRLKFGLEEAEATVDTCIIVMEVEMEGEATVIGAMSDSVKEVFELNPDNIEPPPRMGTRMDTEFISGMGKYNDDFIIILDINEVFSAEELNLFKESMDSPAARKSTAAKEKKAAKGNGKSTEEKEKGKAKRSTKKAVKPKADKAESEAAQAHYNDADSREAAAARKVLETEEGVK